MTNNKATLEEQGVAINWAILDLEREILHTDEGGLRRELVTQLAALKGARRTINWLRDVRIFLEGLGGRQDESQS